MPVIQITMVKGRPDEFVKRCIKGSAKTVHEIERKGMNASPKHRVHPGGSWLSLGPTSAG